MKARWHWLTRPEIRKNYYKLAKERGANIVAVIETHPHADFVSGHLEIHKATGAVIYVSKLLSADYEHKTFDEGDNLHDREHNFKSFKYTGPFTRTVFASLP